jgi:hypothetical protein
LSVEIFRALIPWARSDEGPILKPFWTVISKRSACIGRTVKKTVRARRRDSHITRLSAHDVNICRQADACHRRCCEKNDESLHGFPPPRNRSPSSKGSSSRRPSFNKISSNGAAIPTQVCTNAVQMKIEYLLTVSFLLCLGAHSPRFLRAATRTMPIFRPIAGNSEPA